MNLSPSSGVQVGDHFIHLRPAPGYPANEIIVRGTLRDGWVTVRHYPGNYVGPCQVTTLSNPKHYRRATMEDYCEAADGLMRPCLACPGCARWVHLHEEP